MKLNLGSGPNATEGWVCIDRSPNTWLSRVPAAKRVLRSVGILDDGHMADWDPEVVRGDIRALKYPDGSASAVYTSHTLEHIYLSEARLVLAEASRVLMPGGVIRIALPDARVMAQKFIDNPDAATSRWYNEALLAQPMTRPTGLRALASRAGGHVHRWQPTPALTVEFLRETGLVDIEECGFREGDFPDLETIETRPESFFVQARKAA